MCWERSREARGRSHLAGVRASRSVRLSSACPDFGETAFPLLAGETSEPRRSRCPRRPPPSAPPSRRTFSVFPALSSSDKSLLPPTWPGGRPAAGRCSKRRCRGSPEAVGRAPAGGRWPGGATAAGRAGPSGVLAPSHAQRSQADTLAVAGRAGRGAQGEGPGWRLWEGAGEPQRGEGARSRGSLLGGGAREGRPPLLCDLGAGGQEQLDRLCFVWRLPCFTLLWCFSEGVRGKVPSAPLGSPHPDTARTTCEPGLPSPPVAP